MRPTTASDAVAHAPGVPWLSVLVPAHDAAPHIEAMLVSVLTQADAGVEVVVLDDASRDDTARRVARIAGGDARVRLLRHPTNRGVALARASLLDAARGAYLWFVDADDVLLAGSLPRLRALLREDPVDLVCCDFRTLDALPWRGRRRSTFHGALRGTEPAALVAGSLRAAQLHLWSRIARRELWSDLAFPMRTRHEDMPVVARLLTRAHTWRHVPETWVGYRQRQGSLSRGRPGVGLEDHLDSLDEVRSVLAIHAASADVAVALDYALLRGYAQIARRLARAEADAALAHAARASFLRAFPDGGRAALAACRGRGWWLRALRMASALERAGWQDVGPS